MVAMAVIAITLTAVLRSQSQGVSLANEIKFRTTAALLAQSKLAELEQTPAGELYSQSGDFGDDFPGYSWEVRIKDTPPDQPEGIAQHLVRIDLRVAWGDGETYQYPLRRYCFVPLRP
jgi:general secretion pathway protein I